MINFFALVKTIGFEDICDNYYKLYRIQLLINVLELREICAFNYILEYD
jgi:hypothetical protein